MALSPCYPEQSEGSSITGSLREKGKKSSKKGNGKQKAFLKG